MHENVLRKCVHEQKARAGASSSRSPWDNDCSINRGELAVTRLIHNQKHLVDWVRAEEGPLDVAVAFWGAGAVEELGLDRPGRKVRVLLDLSAGATNTDVVRQLVELYPDQVRSVRRLHAKAFITKSEIAVGSANASANGLGLEGAEARQWHELGLITDDATAVQEVKAWFKKRWSSAEPIDVNGDRFTEAEKLWKENRKRRPRPDSGADNLFTAAIKDPEAFKGRGWYVVIDLDDLSERGEELVEEETRALGRPAFAWENWPKIPPQAQLISVIKDGNRFKFDSNKGTTEPVYYSGDIKRGRMKFVTASHIPGFKGNLGSIREWLPSLKKAEAGYSKWEAEPFASISANSLPPMVF